MNTPKKKGPSLKQVAKTYRKSTKIDNPGYDGGRFFNEGAKPYGVGELTRTNTYKPKAKRVTLGGTRAAKPTTIRKKGKA
jgi:hypothetical protein